MREVEIYSDGINQAKSSTAVATQSSTDSSEPTAVASKAIDGNIISYSATNNEVGAYLQIHLGSPKDITSVTIRNRYCANVTSYDECKCDLSSAVIEFIDDTGTVVYTGFGPSNTCALTDITESLSSNDRCYPSASPSERPSLSPSVVRILDYYFSGFD